MHDSQIAPPAPEGSSREPRHWLYLAIVVTVGILTAMLVPAITRQELHSQSLAISVALATLSFAGIWWYRRRNPALGAGIGAALGVILFLVASLVREIS